MYANPSVTITRHHYLGGIPDLSYNQLKWFMPQSCDYDNSLREKQPIKTAQSCTRSSDRFRKLTFLSMRESVSSHCWMGRTCHSTHSWISRNYLEMWKYFPVQLIFSVQPWPPIPSKPILSFKQLTSISLPLRCLLFTPLATQLCGRTVLFPVKFAVNYLTGLLFDSLLLAHFNHA